MPSKEVPYSLVDLYGTGTQKIGETKRRSSGDCRRRCYENAIALFAYSEMVKRNLGLKAENDTTQQKN